MPRGPRIRPRQDGTCGQGRQRQGVRRAASRPRHRWSFCPPKGQRQQMPGILQKVIPRWRNRIEASFGEIADRMELARRGARAFRGLLARTAATIAAHTCCSYSSLIPATHGSTHVTRLRVTARLRPSRKDPGAVAAPTAYNPGSDEPGNGARRGSRHRRHRPGNPSHAAALRPACRADPFLSVCQEPGFSLLGCCSLLHSGIPSLTGCPALPQHEMAAPTKQTPDGSPSCSICCATAR